MSKPQKIWTLLELIRWSINYLEEKKIDDARSSVEWILCSVLNYSRVDLYLNFDRPLTAEELDLYRPMLLQCASRKPVQQIIGESEFYGLKLIVNEHVLAPRPETELLVEEVIRKEGIRRKEQGVREEKEDDPALRNLGEGGGEGEMTDDENPNDRDLSTAQLPNRLTAQLDILDIGAGSGAIAIALAMNLPKARITAIEKSPEAVEILQRNINYHNLQKRITLINADIFDWEADKEYDFIVSNPPYIAEREMSGLDKRVSHYEPYMALSDGGNGLSFYKYYAEKFINWLKDDGRAILEFGGNDMEESVLSIFSNYTNIEIIRDYQQQARHIFFNNNKMK